MNWKLLLIAALLLAQIGCSSTEITEVLPPASEKPKHRMVAEIARILPPGWEIAQDGNFIVVSRRESVPTYGNIAMPPWTPEVAQELRTNPHHVRYQITIEVTPLLAKDEYEKILEANRETERKLTNMGHAMTDFRSKTTYHPRNANEEEQHQEFLTALRELPYVRLPDLYDESHSYYISTALHSRLSFLYPRQERECRAVLEYILSLADGYGEFTETGEDDEGFNRPFDRLADDVFRNRRDFDNYQLRREDNLRDLTGAQKSRL